MSSAPSSFASRLLPQTAANRKLAYVALTSAALTAASILLAQDLKRRTRRRRLRDQVERREALLNGGEGKGSAEVEGGEEEEEMVDFSGPPPQSTAAAGGSSSSSAPNSSSKSKKPTSEVIILESLARNYAFFGPQSMSKIRGSFVVIVGLGGVGSAAATMLVRSGVGRVRLVDFDQVSLSSLNVSRRWGLSCLFSRARRSAEVEER